MRVIVPVDRVGSLMSTGKAPSRDHRLAGGRPCEGSVRWRGYSGLCLRRDMKGVHGAARGCSGAPNPWAHSFAHAPAAGRKHTKGGKPVRRTGCMWPRTPSPSARSTIRVRPHSVRGPPRCLDSQSPERRWDARGRWTQDYGSLSLKMVRASIATMP